MARMGTDLKLVLLGVGVLSAGYFLYPEPDLEAQQIRKLNEEVGEVEQPAEAQNLAGQNNSNSTTRHYGGSHFIWISSFGRGGSIGGSSGRSPIASTASVSRSGMGTIGRAASAGA